MFESLNPKDRAAIISLIDVRLQRPTSGARAAQLRLIREMLTDRHFDLLTTAMVVNAHEVRQTLSRKEVSHVQ